jgi:uncharacterized RDD family membrane protein YckC
VSQYYEGRDHLAQDNPYATPAARIDFAEAPSLEVAERGTRLAAVIVDGLSTLVLLVPVFLTIPFARDNDNLAVVIIVLMVLGGLGLIAWNCVLLERNGQTIGKKVMGIKVVRRDGSHCGLGRIFGLRYLPVTMLGAVPFLGAFVSLADILMIFGEERRCLHDHFADTLVVKA